MAQEIADSTLLETWSSGGNIVKPDSTKIIEGWQLGEQPPHEYMNWLQNTFGSKLNHILKNGVASWNNETEYLAGSSVQHNGNVWLCKTTNINSAPTDANANWKRIITVESLTTVLAGYVTTTGNQTIAGVKTFSSSPIVPTPTTGTQAANKEYVDTKQSKSVLAYNVNTSSYIPNTLTSGAIIEIGSNANGEYVKFASGTMICYTRKYLLGVVNTGTVFTFPASFIDRYYSFTVGMMSQAGMHMNTYVLSESKTTTDFIIVKSSGYEQASADVTVIGKWK